MPTVEMHGAQVHYWDHGEGPLTVVGVHGAGGDHTAFDPQVDFLASHGVRFITWDMPPFGASQPSAVKFTATQAIEDLLHLLDHLELTAPVLLGQSLGGGIAQRLVKAHPTRARAMVIFGSPWVTGELKPGERLPMKSASVVMSLMPTKRIRSMMVKLVAGTSPNPAMRDEMREMLEAVPRENLLQATRSMGALLDPDPAYRTPIPLCLMRGEYDVTFKVNEIAPRWAAAEGVEEVIIPNAGHAANMDAPDVFNRELLTFLRSLPPSDGLG